MATPARPLNATPLSNSGPPRFNLLGLLHEIQHYTPPTVLKPTNTWDSPAKPQSVSNGKKPSAWISGSPATQDARSKLRAADKARLQKRTRNNFDGTSDSKAAVSSSEGQNTRVVQGVSAPNDGNSQSRISTTSSSNPACDGQTSPRIADTSFVRPHHYTSRSADQNERVSLDMPSPGSIQPVEKVSTRARAPSRSDTNPPTPPHSSINAGNLYGPSNSLIVGETFSDRCHPTLEHSLHDISPFRPDTVTPEGLPAVSTCSSSTAASCPNNDDNNNRIPTPLPESPSPPATPRRSASPSPTANEEYMEGGEIPTWMRPLHLIDGKVSVYMNVHGEDQYDRALCLHCFRQQGNFEVLEDDGCEVCGRVEALSGYYWDAPGGYLRDLDMMDVEEEERKEDDDE